MNVLHIVYKSGSNSITQLTESFEKCAEIISSIYDCKGGDEKWFWKLVGKSEKYDILHFHNTFTFFTIPFIRLKSPSS